MVCQAQLIYCVFITGYMFRPIHRSSSGLFLSRESIIATYGSNVDCNKDTINQLCLTYHFSTLLMQEKVKFFSSVTPYRLVGRVVTFYQSTLYSIFSITAGRTSNIAYGTLNFVPWNKFYILLK